jgi:hypothetical protein
MQLRRLVVFIAAIVMGATAALVSGSPASAYSANSWYRHPSLSSANWSCGSTVNGEYFSAQVCAYYPDSNRPSTRQPVVIVRNRTTSVRAAQVDASIDYGIGATLVTFHCQASGLAASDYSGCFGPMQTTSDLVMVSASVKDRGGNIIETLEPWSWI